MSLIEAFWSALRSLRANITRSALTLLGMVIGVFAVIAAVTAVEVIDTYFQESIQQYGTNTFSVERHGAQFVGPRGGRTYRPPITYNQVETLRERVGADYDIGVLNRFASRERTRSRFAETEAAIELHGADQFFLDNFGFTLESGRPFTEQDVSRGRPVALLGAPVAETLFPNTDPVGNEIRIGRVRLEVVGVLEEKGGFLGLDPDSRVYAPITHLLATYGDGGRNMNSVSVRVDDDAQMLAAQDAIISQMRVIRRVDAGESNNFEIETNESARSTFDAFTATLTIAGAGIGLIALITAGIGIMNIMLVSVTERTREIGIRKSVGAKKRDVLGQFLLEAVVLCQIGGLVGIVLGGLFGNLVAVYFEIGMAFPWDWAMGAVLGVTVIALVFGGYPAYKAARLDPIESLRYE
ncbi:MAG: ABC transporter permease [Longimonas sp.]|uniref:ABC transporter permease n=1 Tax=Longimonas sp. TaxID=2039626 RepID=UPI0033461441